MFGRATHILVICLLDWDLDLSVVDLDLIFEDLTTSLSSMHSTIMLS